MQTMRALTLCVLLPCDVCPGPPAGGKILRLWPQPVATCRVGEPSWQTLACVLVDGRECHVLPGHVLVAALGNFALELGRLLSKEYR